jgi:alpha-amylase
MARAMPAHRGIPIALVAFLVGCGTHSDSVCVDVQGAGTANGTKIPLYDCSGGTASSSGGAGCGPGGTVCPGGGSDGGAAQTDGDTNGGPDDGTPPIDAYAPPATLNPANTYVQLFKWRWKDIATECTTFLGPNGFGAVQVSPPQEAIVTNTWWDIYQPVDYQNLVSDMGNAAELADMIATCHAAGVRIYVDAVLNHVAAGAGTGTAGSSYNAAALQYAQFGPTDFHANCTIQPSDYDSNRNNVVNCRLLGLPDLATDSPPVRTKLTAYLTALVDMGVDGFRLDAAKHMWPADVHAILAGLPKTTKLGEPIFVTQEMVPDGTVMGSDYFVNGTINEFPFTYAVRDAFRGNNGLDISKLPAMVGTGEGGGSWMLPPSENVTVFVDNHDTERSRTDSLNLYDDGPSKRFELAMIYLLGQPYGRAQLQSGFVFSFANTDQNAPAASPYDPNGNALIMVAWDFVHRWSDIYPMVAFRNATAGQAMANIQTATPNTLAFSRGNVGFVALNNGNAAWHATLDTGLPAGTYCNIVHGLRAPGGTSCASDSVSIDGSGRVTLDVGPLGGAQVPAVVLYAGQRLM